MSATLSLVRIDVTRDAERRGTEYVTLARAEENCMIPIKIKAVIQVRWLRDRLT